jgi:hypothetical protein
MSAASPKAFSDQQIAQLSILACRVIGRAWEGSIIALR